MHLSAYEELRVKHMHVVEQLRVAHRDVKDWKSNVETAEAEIGRQASEAESLRLKRAAEWRSKIKLAEASAQREALRARAAADAEVRSLTLKVASLERRLAGKHHVTLARYEADVHARDMQLVQVKERLDIMTELYTQCRLREQDTHEASEVLEAEEEDVPVLRREAIALRELKRGIGVEYARSIPSRTFLGSRDTPYGLSNWRKRTVSHIVGVLADRGEGEGIENIATALGRLGYLERLAESAGFRKLRRLLVQEAMDAIQVHWSARHALQLWDKLELSRSQFDTLRHILSFVYDPDTDKYDSIIVWQDTNDSNCYVRCPCLAGRYSREKLYHRLAADAGILVGANGRCERDAVTLASRMYSNFSEAMRKDFTEERPAQPFLYVDGTGSSLGKGVSHAELGSADFDGTCKQSRSTLSPLSLAEGSDHAGPLRENMPFVASTFNKLIATGSIEREDGSIIPCRACACSDMQAVKALLAQQERSHSPWCKCLSHGNQHKYGEHADPPAQTYADVQAHINKVGCEFRSEEWMCAQSHFSYGVYRGGKFTKFKCSSCGYDPTEAQWRADIAAFESMDDDEQLAARKEHNAGGYHYCQV